MLYEGAAYRGIVVAWVSTNMFDEHVGSLNYEALGLWVSQAYITPVNIAMYRTEGTESLEAFGYLERTDIARMPHFVALGKVFGIAFVPIAMGVGEEPNAFHYLPIRLSI